MFYNFSKQLPMPYNNRYHRYSKSYNKRHKCKVPMFGRADRYAGKKALQLSKYALSMLNVEYKFHDIAITAVNVSSSPIITQITNIPSGDTSESRDGAQIKLTSVNLRYFIEASAADPSTSVRLMLVHDKQTNGAIYSSGDLLKDATADDAIVSPLNLDNKFRFRVLYNKVHCFSNTGNQTQYGEVHIPLNLRLRYDASAGDITDLTSSSLSFVQLSTSTSTNFPAITFHSRVRFVDN